jgi:hypothetical protein
MACVNTQEHLRCYFEIIRACHSQKHYVDIDINLQDDKFNEQYPHSMEEKLAISEIIVDEYANAIIKVYPDIKKTDILVFSSNSDKKRSYHIIVDRWYLPSCKQNKEFFNKCMEFIPLSHRKYFDDRMYKPNQQFRLFLSSKCGKNRIKNISNKSMWKYDSKIIDANLLLKEVFYASLITLTDNGCSLIHTEVKNEFEFTPSRDLDNFEYCSILKLFHQYDDSGSFEVIGIAKNSIVKLKRRRSSYCNVCCRNHDHEHPFIYMSFDNNVYFNCRRNEESYLLGNINDVEEVKKKEVYIPPSVGYEINIPNSVHDDVFNVREKSVRSITPNSVASELIEKINDTPPQRSENQKYGTFSKFREKALLAHSPQGKTYTRPDQLMMNHFNNFR